MPGPTITVRGEGGAESLLDVPDEGTVQRELFDDHLASGRYVVVSGDWPPADEEADSEPSGDESAPPDGTIDDVTAWVRGSGPGEDPADGWPERARLAFDAETAKGDKARSTLLEQLQPLIPGDA